jgi:HAD superfamily hydrolase (TIGR01484 family)
MKTGEEAESYIDGLDEAYFSQYGWCLNAALPVRELRVRLQEEWQRRARPAPRWQHDESRINLYLLLCALHCTASDYLAYRPWRLASLARRVPAFRMLIRGCELAANIPYAVTTALHRRRVGRWNQNVQRCVDAACRMLLDEQRYGPEDSQVLEALMPRVCEWGLPEDVLGWRMRIPEAYRCQDLTHYDVLSLARQFIRSHGAPRRPNLVVGPRTAGAYFAPLVEAFVASSGHPTLGWLSVRPKEGLTGAERGRLRHALRDGGRIVVVDDHPSSGDTFVLLVGLLQALGADAKDIVILAPDHPAQASWTERVQPVATITLPLEDSYKAALLRDDGRLLALVRGMYHARGWRDVRLVASAAVDSVNRALLERFGHTFQTRLKRVIEVRATGRDTLPTSVRLLVKSVGWGWLGYHAYLAGVRLAGHVPEFVGLRDGLMFTEWVGPLDPALPPAPDAAVLAAVPSYVASRAKTLQLTDDPWMAAVAYRSAGWDVILDALRRPFGALGRRLVSPLLKRKLRAYAAPSPMLVDGSMSQENWIWDGGRTYKADFEHHNFGGGEQDFVDPASDLAGALLETNASDDAEDRMIEAYAVECEDPEIESRLLIYKLHAGITAMATALWRLGRPIPEEQRQRENLRYLNARNFLTYQFNRHHARRLERVGETTWTGRLFFLDLDGVFDTQVLGDFPHTTRRGLAALSLLRQHGYSVVPNTGRSVQQVRNYCHAYALPGALAEHGSVFVDRARQREHVLADASLREELRRCRELLRAQRGVFVDPGYEVAVRAYRFAGDYTVGLSREELGDFLSREDFRRFDVIHTSADTYIVPKTAGKAQGMIFVEQHLESPIEVVAAMGDSDTDLEMLRRADIAYMPRNSAAGVLELGKIGGKFRSMRYSRQKALLEAVLDLIRQRHDPSISRRPTNRLAARLVRAPNHLIDRVLDLVDEPPLRQWLDAIRA